jgi:hypothetical protein
MAQNLILLPVFAQVFLTLVVFVVLLIRRGRHLTATGKTPDDVKLATDSDWSQQATAASRCLTNQFEVPVLFFAVAAFVLITRNVDLTMFILAWVFIAARVVQIVTHLSLGPTVVRGLSFMVGLTAVLAMWVFLAVRIIRAGF